MTSGPQHGCGSGKWEHVHQCPQCEHIVKAEDIPRPAIISGVMTCPNCEWSGPMNVQIVKESSTEEPGKVKRVSRAGVV
jgi:hypothetical protein